MTKETSGLTASKFPTDENGEYRIVTRYATATDLDNAIIDNTAVGNSYATDPGAFTLVLKSQSRKYDVKVPEEADKVAVADASNVTDAEFNKLKSKIKLEFSTTNPDKNLLAKRGETVDNQDTKIESITRDADDNVVVTYKDGSKDKRPISDFVRENKVPEVSIPYSVDGKKDIYVYAYEDTNIDLTFTDDSGKIKSATIKQGGNKDLKVKDAAGDPNVLDNEYDLTVKQINEETATPAKVTISGKVTKETATRYTDLKADKFPKTEKDEYVLTARYATATDTDGAFIDNTAIGKTYATDPGAFKLVLKAQTKKYDIKEPTEKTVVNDINKLSES